MQIYYSSMNTSGVKLDRRARDNLDQYRLPQPFGVGADGINAGTKADPGEKSGSNPDPSEDGRWVILLFKVTNNRFYW